MGSMLNGVVDEAKALPVRRVHGTASSNPQLHPRSSIRWVGAVVVQKSHPDATCTLKAECGSCMAALSWQFWRGNPIPVSL